MIDFDAVYNRIFRPAVEECGLRPIRADEEHVGGIIHKPMYERLILCEYAIADLTWANANVYYELGVRHAVRPYSTVLTFVEDTHLPFDLGPIRGLPYHLDTAGRPSLPDQDRELLVKHLKTARDRATDSPIFQVLTDFPVPDVSRLKTDVFRDQITYSTRIRHELEVARATGADAVRAVRDQIKELDSAEFGVIVDLLLSFRAVSAHHDMIDLVDRMPAPVANARIVREQYAFALNRVGRDDEAEPVLLQLIADAPSSETYGLLGRVYKDRWEAARRAGKDFLARGLLDKAIATYLKGFETDWRDHYPGINAVQLMNLRTPPDPRLEELVPVVRYSVARRLASGRGDYWDYATLLELAILSGDRDAAGQALGDALAAVRATWEPESTLSTVRRMREASEREPGADTGWIAEIERELLAARPAETA